jgi:hypothetical protein
VICAAIALAFLFAQVTVRHRTCRDGGQDNDEPLRQAPSRSLRPTGGCRMGKQTEPTDQSQGTPSKRTPARAFESDPARIPTRTMTHRDTPARHLTHSLPAPGGPRLADRRHGKTRREIGSYVRLRRRISATRRGPCYLAEAMKSRSSGGTGTERVPTCSATLRGLIELYDREVAMLEQQI